MQTSVACPNCGQSFQVPSELLGKRLRCLQCQNVFASQSNPQPKAALKPARRTRDEQQDDEASSPRIDMRSQLTDYGVPGWMWMFAAFPWTMLLLALGGCIWGLFAGLTAALLSAGGVALVHSRRLPVGLRLAGLLALDGVAILMMTVGGVYAILVMVNSPREEQQADAPNIPMQFDKRGMQQPRAPLRMQPGQRPTQPQEPALPPAPDVPLPAVQPLFAKGPRVYLADLDEFGAKAGGPWPFGKNGKVGDGRAIRVNGSASPKGLSMHPPWSPDFASVRYRLGRQAAVFRAIVAINETSNWCWSPATFTVLGDGKPLWHSDGIAHNHTHEQKCSVDISGVDVLELRVHCVNGSDGVHAVWLEPRLLQKADTRDE